MQNTETQIKPTTPAMAVAKLIAPTFELGKVTGPFNCSNWTGEEYTVQVFTMAGFPSFGAWVKIRVVGNDKQTVEFKCRIESPECIGTEDEEIKLTIFEKQTGFRHEEIGHATYHADLKEWFLVTHYGDVLTTNLANALAVQFFNN